MELGTDVTNHITVIQHYYNLLLNFGHCDQVVMHCTEKEEGSFLLLIFSPPWLELEFQKLHVYWS